MDPKEVADRLQRVRESIRDHLSAAPPAPLQEGLPAEEALELEAGRRLILPAEPNLNTTADLVESNRRASITGPVALTSRVPVIGPLLTVIRRLFRPLVQAIVDPYLHRQEQFNVHVVRHLNEVGRRLEERFAAVGETLASFDPGNLEARLDAALASYDTALRQRHAVLFSALEEELLALQNLARDGQQQLAADNQRLWAKLVERSQAVDRRFNEKDRALEAALRRRDAGLRGVEQALAGYAELMSMRSRLRQLLERIEAGGAPDSVDGPPGAPGGRSRAAQERREPTGPSGETGDLQALGAWLADEEYRALQAAFRGDPDEIARRMERHIRRFEGIDGPVADLGCGRGEFLDLLVAAGHSAIGVEINGADVAECRSRGLDAVEADLFDWLDGHPPGSLGGVFLAQVIEHLSPVDWSRLVELAAGRLRPGGRLVIETINPESLYAMVRAYVLDPTHVRPVHPSLLAFLARRVGFHPVEIHLQAAVPEEERPLPLDGEAYAAQESVLELVGALNERLARLDALCCAPQEYALIATLAVSAEGEPVGDGAQGGGGEDDGRADSGGGEEES